MSPKEATFAYYSERQVLHPKLIPREHGPALLGGMAAAGVRYLLLDRIHPMSRNRIGPRLLSVCEQVRVVAAFPPRTYLLVVASQADDQDPDLESACGALEYFTENHKPDPTTPAWW